MASSDTDTQYIPQSKADLLQASYYTSMIMQASLIITMVQAIFKNNQNVKEIDEDEVLSKFKGINHKSAYEICERLFHLAKNSKVSLNTFRDVYNKRCLSSNLTAQKENFQEKN